MNEPNLSTPVDPAAAGLDPQAIGRLRAALQARIAAGRLPGAVVLILRRGALGCFEALGRLDPASDAPMTRDAIFRIYSMTKPIVSAAALRLVEQGRLALADPVAKHLPEFAATQVGEERDGTLALVAPRQPMTVHDLMRHTAGLTYEFWPESAVRKRYAEAEVWSMKRSNDEASRLLASLPLMHQPGTVFDYSRATDVLGRLVEVVTGQTLAQHLRETVFEPLGMADSGFHVPEAAHARIAEPFPTDPDSGAAVKLTGVRRPPVRESGGAGMVSTALDYARFLQLMLAEGEHGGVRLLGRKTVQWMTADHLGDLPRREVALPPGFGFGLGVAVRTHAGMAPVPGSVGSWHWSGVAATHFVVDPAEQMVALLMVQAPGLHDELWHLLRNLCYAAVRT